MDRKERLQATLNGENHSGIISGFWYHFSQDAIMQASFDMGGMEHERV